MCPGPAQARPSDAAVRAIDLDLLARIVAEVERWPSVERVWLSHFGGPVLHPEYRRCLEVLASSTVAQRAQVIQFTNGSLLACEQADAILQVPIIDRLVVSLDGCGDGESSEGRRGPHDDQVLGAVGGFAARVAALRPDLELFTETIPAEEGEAPDSAWRRPEEAEAALSSLLAPFGAGVRIRPLRNYSGSDVQEVAVPQLDRVCGGCPFVEEDSVYLTVDGRAQPCCNVSSLEFNIGSIRESGLGTLLSGAPMSELRRQLRLDQRDGLPFCRDCRYSLGGLLEETALRAYWLNRDRMATLDDLGVRQHLFEQVVPTEHRALRLDIGSGGVARPGFVGVDRFAFPGVSVVADFDQGLPFADSTFDLVYAGHSLEHARDLVSLMQDICRVAKDRAQVCIVAPYYLTSINMANPFHRQVFTEETPRFWAKATSQVAEPGLVESAGCPHVPATRWGLSESDHAARDFDFRCLRMEFFYWPEYRALPAGEQRRLRHTQLNVCDQIMYHLLVVKSPLSDEEQERAMHTMEYYQPPHVTIRKAREEIEALNRQLALAAELQTSLRREIDAARAEADAAHAEAETVRADQRQLWEETAAIRTELAAAAEAARAEQQRVSEESAGLRAELGLKVEQAGRLEAEAEQQREAIARLERTLATEAALRGEAVREAEQTQARAADLAVRATGLASAVLYLEEDAEQLRRNLLVRWLQRMQLGPNWRARLSEDFQPLIDDALLFGGGLRGFVLRPSCGLQGVAFLPYEMTLGRPGWCGVTVAPLADLPRGAGCIGLEIVSPGQQLIRHERIPLSDVEGGRPLRFSFAPIAESNRGTFELRLFVKDVSGGVRVLEWRRPSFAGLRPPARRPFCALHFE